MFPDSFIPKCDMGKCKAGGSVRVSVFDLTDHTVKVVSVIDFHSQYVLELRPELFVTHAESAEHHVVGRYA